MWPKGLLLLIAGAQFLAAAPIPVCATGTLASYMTLGSCTVGPDLTFYNFSLVSTLDVPLPADASLITVTPDQSDMGLDFSSSSLFQVTGAESGTYVLTYSVDAHQDPVSVMEGMPLDPHRRSPAQVSVLTAISLGADFTGLGCPLGTPCTSLNLFSGDTGSVLNASVSFAPVDIVGMQETISLQAGGGAVNLASLDNTFTTVSTTPEPHSGLLCALGILGLLGWRRDLFRRR